MDKRIEDIAEHYGYEKQKLKLVEEIGELLQALIKLDYADDKSVSYLKSRDHLLEEIADVGIMLDQIVYLHDGEGRTEAKRTDKLDRQIKRIEEEQKADTLVPVVYGVHGFRANEHYKEYCWRLPESVRRPLKGEIMRVNTKKGIDNIYVTRTGEMSYIKAKELKTAIGYVEVKTGE